MLTFRFMLIMNDTSTWSISRLQGYRKNCTEWSVTEACTLIADVLTGLETRRSASQVKIKRFLSGFIQLLTEINVSQRMEVVCK